jgi:hypothetical protein
MKLLKHLIATFIIALSIYSLALFAVWAERYHYQDCLRVGHTRTYCVLDIVR